MYDLILLMCIYECLHVSMCAMCMSGAHQDQEGDWLDSLELELQAVANSTWLLGTKSGSSARTASTLTAEPSLQSQLLFSKNVFLWSCEVA